jgi:hypothetical protein
MHAVLPRKDLSRFRANPDWNNRLGIGEEQHSRVEEHGGGDHHCITFWTGGCPRMQTAPDRLKRSATGRLRVGAFENHPIVFPEIRRPNDRASCRPVTTGIHPG